MKNFSFKNKGAYLRVIEEPTIKKKKWTFDRITFIIVLSVIALSILRFAYNVLNVIEGDGQIVFEKTSVNFTDDIRLKNIFVEEGQKIMAGDTVFSFTLNNKISNFESEINKAAYKAKSQRELLSLDKEMDIKRVEISGIKKIIGYKKTLLENTKKMVLLEVESYKSLEVIKTEIANLDIQENQLKLELDLLKKMRPQLSGMRRELLNTMTESEQFQYYISPVTGVSGAVNFQANEVCYKQQEALTLHNPEQVQIRAYFSQKFAKNLNDGEIIKVIFPDGTKSQGIIKHSYIATYALPSEFQKKYEPTQRNIMLNISPINKSEEDIWRKFYLMDVKLVKNRILIQM